MLSRFEHAFLRRFVQDLHPRGFHSTFRKCGQLREPVLHVWHVVVSLEVCLVCPYFKFNEKAR